MREIGEGLALAQRAAVHQGARHRLTRSAAGAAHGGADAARSTTQANRGAAALKTVRSDAGQPAKCR